ncbi:DUF4936 family protein [Thiobacillus denitrificans]|uniref:DUF4936 domain-containing protein n=1 Tax=Thiobacillus denitrificans TaxID=36861 RepID=A0A119CYB9_THIDE|nr:DUF4936 family protein [Thiobacillus denitrificans]KVW99569.1 hypothetical protein ABW22_01145 [Thiobacillus denitrificans]
MKSVYVYYRIDPVQASLAATRIDALLDTMATPCSQPPRRLNRCDDAATWMEIYEGIADFAAFAAALNAAVQTADCAAFTRGERHLECFFRTDR